MADTTQEQANRRLVIEAYEHVLKPLDSSRVGRIAEHWDVNQPVPEIAANANGMF